MTTAPARVETRVTSGNPEVAAPAATGIGGSRPASRPGRLGAYHGRAHEQSPSPCVPPVPFPPPGVYRVEAVVGEEASTRFVIQ
jgi:hypothetical protein